MREVRSVVCLAVLPCLSTPPPLKMSSPVCRNWRSTPIPSSVNSMSSWTMIGSTSRSVPISADAIPGCLHAAEVVRAHRGILGILHQQRQLCRRHTLSRHMTAPPAGGVDRGIARYAEEP
jgi:hypothetical protein